jgi:hypothetical protein
VLWKTRIYLSPAENQTSDPQALGTRFTLKLTETEPGNVCSNVLKKTDKH